MEDEESFCYNNLSLVSLGGITKQNAQIMMLKNELFGFKENFDILTLMNGAFQKGIGTE